MTVTRNIDKLDSAEVFVHQAIKATSVEKLLQFLNALREGLTDSVAPGGGTQLYRGHDHGHEGGVPIINGSQLTYDGGMLPVFEKTDWDKALPPTSWHVGKFYASPGLATSGDLKTFEIAICYETVGSAFEFSVVGGRTYETKLTTDGKTEWIIIERPIQRSGDWDDLFLQLRPSSFPDESIELRIYSVNLVETYQASQPSFGVRDVQTATSSRTILRYFGEELADELAEDSLNADTLKRIFSACNALLECTIDRRAPGASTQVIKGHDHYNSGQLGRAIGHGKIYSAGVNLDTGGGGVPEELWLCNATTLNQWEYADLSNGTDRRTDSGSRPGATVTTTGMFWGAVSGGITSSGSPPTSAPYLEAWVYVDHDDKANANVELRLRNLTAGSTVSQTITLGTSFDFKSWKYIQYIPATGGSWNNFVVEVRNTAATTGSEIRVRAIVLSESYTYNGNKAAYALTNGTKIVGTPPSGTETVTP